MSERELQHDNNSAVPFHHIIYMEFLAIIFCSISSSAVFNNEVKIYAKLVPGFYAKCCS